MLLVFSTASYAMYVPLFFLYERTIVQYSVVTKIVSLFYELNGT